MAGRAAIGIGGRLRRGALAAAWAATLAACGPRAPDPRVPDGYGADYAGTIDAAEREGRVVIWSTTDTRQARDLLAAFRRRHPRIATDYRDMASDRIDQRFRADARAGNGTADLLWSSAMDLQIRLVNDGFAQRYHSPERAALPDWANWKDEAWGVTAEPIVLAYNRRLVAPAAVPDSHVALRRALEARAFADRIATYDPARSGVGYLIFSQDDGATRDLQRTVRALGASRARLFATAEGILGDVTAGRSAIGYNVAGSYAADAMRTNRDLGIVLPRDYTLVMSRIAMIPAGARHPNAARLFLDFLLSPDGQRALRRHAMFPVRRDMPAPDAFRAEAPQARAIRVSPALLVLRDQLTRRRFLKRWDRALAEGRAAAQPGAVAR